MGGLKLIGSFLVLLFAAALGGSVVRGEASPWVWQELAIRSKVPSVADQIVCVLWYAALYSVGFLVPFWATTFVLFLIWNRLAPNDPFPSLPTHIRRARLCVSLSALAFFLVFLEPMIAFIRALPTEQWNGWPLTIGVAVGVCFAYLGYREFRESSRTRQQVKGS